MRSFEIPLFTKKKVWKLTIKEPQILDSNMCVGFERKLRNKHFLVYIRLRPGKTWFTYGIKNTIYGIE